MTTRPRPDKRAASREPEVEAEEVEGAELISLEEADAETQGKRAEAAEDVEAAEAIEDDAEGPIIEQEEEETPMSRRSSAETSRSKRRLEERQPWHLAAARAVPALGHLLYGQLDRSYLRSSRPLATMDFLLLPIEKVSQIADQHQLPSGW